MESIRQKEIEKPKFKALCTDADTDVLIIGGGLCGILCAHMLRSSGIDCIVAEAKQICGGNTKNTTAKITLHHGAVFDRMIGRIGKEKSELYIKANSEAVEKYKRLAKTTDCGCHGSRFTEDGRVIDNPAKKNIKT